MPPNATEGLMTKLQGADPGSVPADTIAGEISSTRESSSVWSAIIPVNGGTVTLRLIPIDGQWRVDGIDWDPS